MEAFSKAELHSCLGDSGILLADRGFMRTNGMRAFVSTKGLNVAMPHSVSDGVAFTATEVLGEQGLRKCPLCR